ncbi:unnamed protein product, partial [Owenia fusiformis]
DPLNGSSSTPPKCCPPQLYQADIRMTQGLTISGQSMANFLDGHWWFDRWNKTNAYEGIFTMNGHKSEIKFIQDNVAKKQYNINKAGRTCDVIDQAFPHFDGCIPESASFMGQENLGKDFMVNTWSAKLQSDAYDIAFEMTVTPDDCIPITVTTISEATAEYGVTSTTRFSSFQEGIQDMSVFDIPDYCQK